MDTILAVITFTIGVVIAVVFGVIAAPRHVRVGVVLLWSSAIPLAVWCFIWELTTDATMIFRIAIGLLVGTFVFVIVPETVRWMKGIQPARENVSTSTTINKNVTSHGQSGGITGHTVNTNER